MTTLQVTPQKFKLIIQVDKMILLEDWIKTNGQWTFFVTQAAEGPGGYKIESWWGHRGTDPR